MGESIFKCIDCAACTDKIPFFSLLTPEELEIINSNRFSVRFKPDELILKQGISATHVLSLITGVAKIYIEGLNSRNLLFRLSGPWQLIDEPGVHINGINQFSVTALTEVQVCFIEGKNFRHVMSQNSAFACEVLKHRSEHTSFFYQRLISLTQKQMLGRMADGLLYLSQDFYKSDNFNMNLSRQELADMTAMSKDSAIRILKEFERENVIALNGRKIKILNMKQLLQISARG